MSTRLGWYAWFPADILAETASWPEPARLAFRELLDHQWCSGLLPADPEALRVLVRMNRDRWRGAWSIIERHFPLGGGGRRNAELEANRAKARELVAVRSRAGQAGNRARWGSPGQKVVQLKRDRGDDG
jgi:uncharacterized protein YdaU (DUF1376 family)